MAHKLERSLCSLTAIAAASLLLSTAPAQAQSAQSTPQSAQSTPQSAQADPAPSAQPPTPQADAQPADSATPPTAPTAAPPADPAPPPTTTPVPVMTANPIVQPLPDSSQAAETPAPAPQAKAEPARPAPARITHTTARTAETRTSATTPPAPQPPAQPSTPLTRRDPAGLYTADGTPVAAPAKPVVATQPSPLARYWPLEAAGVIILMGLAGYAATRRRAEDEEETAPVNTAPMGEPATPEPETPVGAPVAAPVMTMPARETTITAAPRPTGQPLTSAPSASLEREEAPSASILPAGPVPTGPAREALLKRMVAAPPDAANPFHTVKARMRRARMILAARKQALHDRATEAFDWRTYKPSLTHVTLGGETTAPATKGKRETIK
jgi:hypothetical protein